MKVWWFFFQFIQWKTQHGVLFHKDHDISHHVSEHIVENMFSNDNYINNKKYRIIGVQEQMLLNNSFKSMITYYSQNDIIYKRAPQNTIVESLFLSNDTVMEIDIYGRRNIILPFRRTENDTLHPFISRDNFITCKTRITERLVCFMTFDNDLYIVDGGEYIKFNRIASVLRYLYPIQMKSYFLDNGPLLLLIKFNNNSLLLCRVIRSKHTVKEYKLIECSDVSSYIDPENIIDFDINSYNDWVYLCNTQCIFETFVNRGCNTVVKSDIKVDQFQKIVHYMDKKMLLNKHRFKMVPLFAQ